MRVVNSLSDKNSYPIPFINDILGKVSGSRYITSINLEQSFFQVELEDASKEVTAFTVQGKGLFQFVRMPFGQHSAGATFQRLMDTVLDPVLQQYTFCYKDDVILATETFEQHIELLQKNMELLLDSGLKINLDKSKFCKKYLKY
jgi:hypothetical protein